MISRCAGHLGGLAGAVESGSSVAMAEDLVVLLPGVNHGHQADGSRVNDRQRNHAFLAEHQNVERVVIFGQGLGDEAIVGG